MFVILFCRFVFFSKIDSCLCISMLIQIILSSKLVLVLICLCVCVQNCVSRAQSSTKIVFVVPKFFCFFCWCFYPTAINMDVKFLFKFIWLNLIKISSFYVNNIFSFFFTPKNHQQVQLYLTNIKMSLNIRPLFGYPFQGKYLLF